MATITLSPTLTPVLERVSPASQGIDEICLARLYARIEAHIAAGWYPGAAIAMARHGKLVATRSFGVARLATAGVRRRQQRTRLCGCSTRKRNRSRRVPSGLS